MESAGELAHLVATGRPEVFSVVVLVEVRQGLELPDDHDRTGLKVYHAQVSPRVPASPTHIDLSHFEEARSESTRKMVRPDPAFSRAIYSCDISDYL